MLPTIFSATRRPPRTRVGALLTTLYYATQGILSLFQNTYESNPRTTPHVITPDGPIQGKLGTSRGDQEFWQFLGIPYAQPPVDDRRFEPPEPVEPWKELRKTIKFPPACAQYDPLATGAIMGREDCLFLNVFCRPVALRNGTVPVLVYFHGGVFAFGESAFNHANFLMDHNIVVVTVQYRLGPLGFLNLEDQNLKYPRGNAGLKDQNLALQWVQRSISVFGGDPSRVTIMGDSAGGSSVHFHMISPKSQGLFHRAIAHSGAVSQWVYTEEPRNIAQKYAKRLGCNVESTDAIYKCMKSMDFRKMVQYQWTWNHPSLENDNFVPSLERVVTNDTFLSESPMRIMRSGKMARVPLMTGVTSGDGALRSARLETYPESIQKLGQNWDDYVGRLLFFDEDIMTPKISEMLKSYYFGDIMSGSETQNRHAVMKAFTELSGDALFNEPMHLLAVEHARHGAPTYLYYYEYQSRLFPGFYSFYRAARLHDGPWGTVRMVEDVVKTWVRQKIFGGEETDRSIYGVAHTAQMFQVWDILGVTGGVVNAGDRELSEEFVRSIVDFMHDRQLFFRGVRWPAINGNATDNLPYMKIEESGQGIVTTTEPMAERMKFWDTLAPLRKDRQYE